jgi:hypothetical protein
MLADFPNNISFRKNMCKTGANVREDKNLQENEISPKHFRFPFQP